jgi:hypothetical protein
VQLHSRVDAAKGILASCHPIDLAGAAHEWSQSLRGKPARRSGYDSRLAAAAQAAAVNKDGNLVHARDLELAARAAGAIEARVHELSRGKTPDTINLDAFASAMDAIQRDYFLSLQSAGNHSPGELTVAREAAERAREEMLKFASEGNSAKNSQCAPARLLRGTTTSAPQSMMRPLRKNSATSHANLAGDPAIMKPRQLLLSFLTSACNIGSMPANKSAIK